MAAGAALLLCGCSQKSNTMVIRVPSTGGVAFNGAVTKPTGSVAMLPKKTAFKMSGDYADHVAVTLDAAGNLVYYPAPSDISAASAPVKMEDGWWLNRQGLGPGSVFTRWTFAEYAALKKTPSQEEIKKAIIPGACVTAFKVIE